MRSLSVVSSAVHSPVSAPSQGAGGTAEIGKDERVMDRYIHSERVAHTTTRLLIAPRRDV
jgi:hypothetical protein